MGQPISVSRITPNQKIAGVNTKFGNRGIKKQQGTTRVIYDTLTLTTGVPNYRFFEGVNTRTFPATNVGQSGNGLQVGESLSIDRMYLSIVLVDVISGDVVSVSNLTARPDIGIGEVSIKIANTIVLKPIPLSSFDSIYNKSSNFGGHANFEFDTNLILPPLLEFVVEVRTLVSVGTVLSSLRLTIEGVGAILAPRATF